MKIDINKIQANTNNPRSIKEHKFKKLVQSIKDFPEMLEKRPIVVDETMTVLGGNMRLKACQEAGLKQVDIIIAKDWTKEQKEQFIVKDNVGFGDWDWDILANDWNNDILEEWGLDMSFLLEEPNFNELTENKEKKPPTIKITFKNVEDLEEAELIIKDLILKYKNSFYSVS